MYCINCGDKVQPDWSFCPNCQHSVNASADVESPPEGSVHHNEELITSVRSTIQKIWDGDAGLAFTYWGIGVVGNVVFAVLSLSQNDAFLILIGFAAIVFWVFISVSVWRAATKYGGPKGWANTAKVMVVLGVFGFLVGLMNG